MAIDTVTAAAPGGTTRPGGTPAPSPTKTTPPDTSKDFDTFLKLMTAQLRHQDPMQPLDGTAFVAQLAQFSTVEQQVKANTKLDDLLAAVTRTNAQAAAGLLGRDVEATGGRIEMKGGATSFAFEREASGGTVEASIADATGREVRRLAVPAGAGRHIVTWDGKDEAGAPLADGVYAVTVKAEDAEGKALDEAIPVVTRAEVVAVKPGETEARFVLSNGVEIGAADLRTIR